MLVLLVSLFQAPVFSSAALIAPLRPYLPGVMATAGLVGAHSLLEQSAQAAPDAAQEASTKTPSISVLRAIGTKISNFFGNSEAVTKAALPALPNKLPTMEVLEKLIAEAKTAEALKTISDKYMPELLEIAKENTEISKRIIPAIIKLGGKDPSLPPPSAFSEFLSKIGVTKYTKYITDHPYIAAYVAAGFAYTCMYKPLRKYYYMQSEIRAVTGATATLTAHRIATQANTTQFLNDLRAYEPQGWLERGLDVAFGGHVILASLYSKLPTIRFN